MCQFLLQPHWNNKSAPGFFDQRGLWPENILLRNAYGLKMVYAANSTDGRMRVYIVGLEMMRSSTSVLQPHALLSTADALSMAHH